MGTLLLSMILSALIASCAALHVPQAIPVHRSSEWKTVLFLGDSVDRFAIEDNFDVQSKTYSADGKENRVAYDAACGVSVAYQFLPGVGYGGNLTGPFLMDAPPKKATQHIIAKQAVDSSRMNLGTVTPNLVVVGSGLWDLAVWKKVDGTFPTSERIQQWCHQDIPNLLSNVSSSFPSSRIAFRTQPPFRPNNNLTKFNSQGVEEMYQCIHSAVVERKLFGKYTFIDYHAIFKNLIRNATGSYHPRSSDKRSVDKVASFWRADSYHPSSIPGRMYINAILDVVGAKQLDSATATPVQSRQRGPPIIGSGGIGYDIDNAGLH